jgi:hypothetical protein
VGSPFSVLAHISHNWSTQQPLGFVVALDGDFPPVANDEKLTACQAAKAGHVHGTRREKTKKIVSRVPWFKC